MIPELLHWLYSLSDTVIFVTIMTFVVVVVLVWWAIDEWLHRRDQRVFQWGYHEGVVDGRREERMELDKLSADSDREAGYPYMIIDGELMGRRSEIEKGGGQ